MSGSSQLSYGEKVLQYFFDAQRLGFDVSRPAGDLQ